MILSSGYFIYIAITGVFTLIGMVVSNRLKAKFHQYSQMRMSNGKSGAEVAADMLRYFGITDVKISMGQGMLTDHYNPLKKEVKLSPDVYQGRSVAAAAVAAHECGHAVQHAKGYAWLQMRSAIVPVVQVASGLQNILLMFAVGGFVVGFAGEVILLITCIVFGITALFSLITLPVEFDASNRALAWLDSSGYTSGREHAGAKDALWWAAMTYVVAALSALAAFFYFLLRYLALSRD
jgi:Zn-dependent membrane protease YugP